MTEREALKLALEALVEVKSWKSPTRWDGCFDKEITAIKEVLNGCQCPECKVAIHASDCAVHNEPAYSNGKCNCGAQPEQEPVGFMNAGHVHDMQQGRLPYGYVYPKRKAGISVAIYTTPPQRKPLTDEEIDELWELWLTTKHGSVTKTEGHIFARAIEAAHGIKGEA